MLNKLKSDERTKLSPIVMMTSSKEEQDIVESQKLGVNSMFFKPVDFDNFSKTDFELGFYRLVANTASQQQQ